MHKVEDRAGARPAASQLLTLKLAKKKELAKALNVNRNTLSRRQQKMLQEGVAGLVDKTRGPKGAYKLTGEVLAQAQQCLY
ncbi:helix-turn-helix domain-containing protein, partial [Dehalococcoidia bacterium]|nr:helix-turn-helix domain-containing protein [Dehalococcoidia bacterium]